MLQSFPETLLTSQVVPSEDESVPLFFFFLNAAGKRVSQKSFVLIYNSCVAGFSAQSGAALDLEHLSPSQDVNC